MRIKESTSKEKRDIQDIGNISISKIRIIITIVGLLFSYLAIQSPFKNIFSEQIALIDYSLVLKLIVLIFFNSKAYGILVDIMELQRELIKIKIRTIPIWMNILGALYTIIFGLILFSIENFIQFCALFILLKIIYLLFWRKATPYFIANIKETFKKNVLEKNEIEKFQNKILINYFNGKWVVDVSNFIIIPSITAIITKVSNFDNTINNLFNIKSENLILSFLILLGILLSEGIVWTKRLKRKYQIRYLDANYKNINVKLIRK